MGENRPECKKQMTECLRAMCFAESPVFTAASARRPHLYALQLAARHARLRSY
jgi:hypothetical protein